MDENALAASMNESGNANVKSPTSLGAGVAASMHKHDFQVDHEDKRWK